MAVEIQMSKDTTSINNAYIYLWQLPLIFRPTVGCLLWSCLLEPFIFPFIAAGWYFNAVFEMTA